MAQSSACNFMQSAEPNEAVLQADLQHLAAYLVKIGTNVNLGIQKATRNRLKRHRELDIDRLAHLIHKYKLTWSPKCDLSEFNANNHSLYQIALGYPQIFIQAAANLTPGSYDERRFWWCANNYRFYHENTSPAQPYIASNYHRQQANPPVAPNRRPSRLLSDIFHILLTPDEPKLVTICALHSSIKHSEPQVFHQWFEQNLARIDRQIHLDAFGKSQPALKKKLRRIFRVKEAELALDDIHVGLFVEWWNLTGLRRPPPGSSFEHDRTQSEDDQDDNSDRD